VREGGREGEGRERQTDRHREGKITYIVTTIMKIKKP
jgi:hypothetical protein